MSSSSEAVTRLATPQLRSGSWTRLGDVAVLGDAVTEQTLSALAESTRGAARAQGYAVGWAEGRRAAEAEARIEAEAVAEQVQRADAARAAEHSAAVAALREAATLLMDFAGEAREAVAAQAVELATELTETILGCTLAATDDTGALAVRRAVTASGNEPLTRLWLNPADLPSDSVAALREAGVQVLADASLSRGDALAELDDHVLDLRVATAMERVRVALREDGAR